MPRRERPRLSGRIKVLGAPLGRPRRLGLERFPVQEATLPNGLRVRLLADRFVPAAALYTFFAVGSRHERPGLTGIAHLFEHMYFNGASRYGPREFDRVLEGAGGHSNAFTTHDFTAYYEDFPAEALAQVLDLESDRMRSLSLSPEMLASEREVVREERRLTVENDVLGVIDEELFALAFQAHPYRWPVIGWMDDLDRIGPEECRAFFRAGYAPGNAVLWIVGDIDPAATLRLIERHYGDIPPGPPAPEAVSTEPPQRGERRAEVRFPAHGEALAVAYRAPAAGDPLAPVLDVLQYALGAGEGARLIRSLVYDQMLAADVTVDFSWRRDPGVFVFLLELNPGVRAERALAALDRELARVAETRLLERERMRATGQLRAQVLRELSTDNGRAHAFGTNELLLGDWRAALALPERYAQIGAEQVRASAEALFRRERRSVVTLVPTAAREARHG